MFVQLKLHMLLLTQYQERDERVHVLLSLVAKLQGWLIRKASPRSPLQNVKIFTPPTGDL